MKPWVTSPAPATLGVELHTYDIGIWEAETGSSETQEHPWLYSQLEASLKTVKQTSECAGDQLCLGLTPASLLDFFFPIPSLSMPINHVLFMDLQLKRDVLRSVNACVCKTGLSLTNSSG